MNKEDRDYGIYLAVIAIWVMIGGLAQCENARHLNDIRKELREIKYELNIMKYK